MKINKLFNIHYGSKDYHAKGWLADKKGNTPLISSKASNRGIYGYFDIIPNYSHVLTVPSTGSIGYALYQKNPCCVDDNTLVLEPLVDMTERQLIFYSLVIRQYAGRFMYGRQVTPARLGELEAPSLEEIPTWVDTMDIPSFDDIAEAKYNCEVVLPDQSLWKDFKYSELFEIKKVSGPKVSDIKKTVGNIPYVSATSENNGIVHHGDFEPTVKGNCITVGHLGDCFYQPKDFAGSNATALLPKFELNKARAMFLLPLLNASKFKYCYGRVIGINRLKNEIISLPVDENNLPNWQLMEQYINSLSYSKYL